MKKIAFMSIVPYAFVFLLGCGTKDKPDISIASTIEEYCQLSLNLEVEQLGELSMNGKIMQLSILHLPEIDTRVAEIKKIQVPKYELSDEELEFAIYTRLVRNMNRNCKNYQNFVLEQLDESPPESDGLRLLKKKTERFISEQSSKKKDVTFSKMTDFVSDALYLDPELQDIAEQYEQGELYLLHHSEAFRAIYFDKMQMQELKLKYNQIGEGESFFL